MTKKSLAIILILYFLVLVQTSFLAHFSFFGISYNLVLIFVIAINLLGFSPWQKIFSATVGGFFLDVFSLSLPFGMFGFYTVILTAGSLILKIFLERYVRIPFFQKK